MNDSILSRDKALKKVMRQLPYPVTIVTAAAGERIRGITIGSFTSLSMSPPLICFNVEEESQMHPVLEEASHFAVHIPGSGQEDLCNRFAMSDVDGTEQFEGISYTPDDQGTPVLEDTVAVIYCRKYNLIKAGDHSIVIGEVLKMERRKEEPCILYFNRAYHKVGPRLHGSASRIAD